MQRKEVQFAVKIHQEVHNKSFNHAIIICFIYRLWELARTQAQPGALGYRIKQLCPDSLRLRVVPSPLVWNDLHTAQKGNRRNGGLASQRREAEKRKSP